MMQNITHNVNLDGHTIQSYSLASGTVVIDYNGQDFGTHQRWSIDEARSIARLLTLAVADAELGLRS